MSSSISPLSRRAMTTSAGRVLSFTSLGFGGALVGNMHHRLSEAEAGETIRAAWASGVRYFDTAPLYGYGLSERRIGKALREQPRDSFLVSSKVGLLTDTLSGVMEGGGAFRDPPQGSEAYSYGYDAIMRSVEASLDRLGLESIDIFLVHDIDAETHGSVERSDTHLRALVDGGGWRALDELRRQGVTRAIGAGLNEWEMSERLLNLLDPDVFLLAGRYTLLEQNALASFLPGCVDRGVGVVVGGPYNSGVLVTGAAPGARYNYGLAPQWVLDKVAALERLCRSHGVALAAAALQFPLGHPAVMSVIPGALTASEVERNVAAFSQPVPPGLWSDMKAEGLLDRDTPVPSAQGAAAAAGERLQN